MRRQPTPGFIAVGPCTMQVAHGEPTPWRARHGPLQR
jgi:hypothetical protein